MGKLILLNSGIGNVDDISLKVRQYLEKGAYFAVEDTRKFRDLLRRLDLSPVNKVIESFHDHSGNKKLKKILSWLEIRDVYVVSDAGSPIIADPAFPLVQMALEHKVEVSSASGVSSFLHALELSGLPPHPFTFWGFLPREEGKKVKLINNLSRGTHIFLEAPHRLLESLGALTIQYPCSSFVVAKELSKTYEKIYHFKGQEFNQVKSSIDIRGEFVLLLRCEREREEQDLRPLAQDILNQGMRPKQVAKLLARILPEEVKDIYQKLISSSHL